MRVSDMIQRSARTFQDEAMTLVVLDEWKDFVHEFMLDYAGRTEQFRTRQRLSRGYNPWCLELPKNIVTLLWCAYDDTTLLMSSYKELEMRDPQFLQRTGTPSYAYRDLSSPTQLRLYPAPIWATESRTQFQGYAADWDGVTAAVDTDNGVLHRISDSENTFTMKRALPFGGTAAVTAANEKGHIVALVRTDSPMAGPGVKQSSDFGAQMGGGRPGKIAAFVTSNVEIAYSYVPEFPVDETGFLATEIPFQDQNEMAGVYYLLFRAYAKSIETSDLNKGEYYRQLYEERVNQGLRKKSDSWAPRRRRVAGRFM